MRGEAERARLDAARIKALALIKSGDDAEAEINQLLQEFSGHSGLAVVIHSLASEYERQGKYEKARNLHQQIIQQWPENARADRARFDFSKTTVLSLIHSGEYAAAEAKLAKFTADFGGHSLFTRAMVPIGEQYYIQGCVKEGQGDSSHAEQLYEKAITVLSLVTGQSQSYEFTPVAWYLTGRCYRGLGNYEKGIECCEKVTADWPDHRYAGESQFLVGRSYEKLAKAGAMSRSEAKPKIKAAYQRLVENYPDCEAARYAQRWLGRHGTEF